jgi:DNA-binding CsgD family transcriptional regulator/tetratricopeptide (TPR) repeat protein
VLGRHAALDLVVEVSDCEVAAIDECVEAALVVTKGDQLVFRHDLTRETIEDAMTPLRRRQLHRLALQALRDSDDIVQRAHHALGSGDRDAIIDLATCAGDACVALGAHRQAAILYQRALEHEDGFGAAERLRITQAYATTCLNIEHIDQALIAGDRARDLLVDGGDQTEIGDWESWLSNVYWAAGRVDEALSLVTTAVERLEPHGPSPALARALVQLAAQHMLSGRFDLAISEGRRALDLAERFDLDAVAVRGLDVVGTSMSVTGQADGLVLQHEALDRAKRAGLAAAACLACVNIGGAYVSTVGPARAADVFTEGIEIAEEHELVYRRNCLLAFRLDVFLLLGRWDDAVADARALLDEPNLAAHHRGLALSAIGRIHARRGEPGATAALDLALEVMEAIGEPQFVQPVRMARAELAWLGGNDARARAEVEATLPLVDRLDAQNLRDVERWARRTQVDWRADAHDATSEQLRAGARPAAAFWEDLGCPYEAADALADGDDEDDLRDALARLLELEARPRAQQVARRLRALGVKDVPRGPRASTRANAAGLTGRELEVAALLAAGLRNADIADRFVLSSKTVDHHVSAVLSKLGIRNRRLVAKAASELGIGLGDPTPGAAGY